MQLSIQKINQITNIARKCRELNMNGRKLSLIRYEKCSDNNSQIIHYEKGDYEMFMNIFREYGAENSISSLITYKNNNISKSSDYITFSENGYAKNVVVYRCIHLIARAVSSVDWMIKTFNNEEEIDEITYKHEILNLLKHPNSRQSRTSFLESIVSCLLLSGNCYILSIRDRSGNVKELHTLRPDRVRIIPGNKSMPLGYEYIVGNSRVFYEINQKTGVSEIIHIKLFNPVDDWYGMSPVSVAMDSIEQHNAIASQNLSFLRNGGRPSGALIYKSDYLNPQQKKKLRDDLKQAYEGTKNAGKIILLEGEFEWKEMGLSPKDLDFGTGKEMAAKEIALVFGIPPILIGITSDATFSNYKEARYNFWEETVLPILNLISEDLSVWLSNIYNSRINLSYDVDSIQALSKRRETEWRKINESSFLTDNEKREALGYAPISGELESVD